MPMEHEPEDLVVGRSVPVWVWALCVAIVLALVVAFAWALVPGPPHPSGWTPVGGTGRAYVFTRCEGTTKLVLTLDVNGDPVGPVQTAALGCP